MALPGVSTLGLLLGYAVESTAGTRPTSGYKLLSRINAVGGIALDVESIDASALEDLVSSSVAGRADTGGSFPVTVNITNDTISEWETLISAYQTAQGSNKKMWFEIWSPSVSKAFFVAAQPPQQIPMPESNQNELWTVEINLTIVEYHGLDTASKPTGAGA